MLRLYLFPYKLLSLISQMLNYLGVQLLAHLHHLCCSSAFAAPIDRLAWLGGCWASTTGEPGSGEQWLAPAGGSMLGVGRTIKNGKTVQYEFLHIRADDDGKLLYTALPSGQKPATFTEKTGDKDGRQIRRELIPPATPFITLLFKNATTFQIMASTHGGTA